MVTDELVIRYPYTRFSHTAVQQEWVVIGQSGADFCDPLPNFRLLDKPLHLGPILIQIPTHCITGRLQHTHQLQHFSDRLSVVLVVILFSHFPTIKVISK